MAPSAARFPVGTRVQVAEVKDLARFVADWKSHHPLEPEQLEHAGVVTTVREVTYYQGGDPLYVLDKVPGTWHESCLRVRRTPGTLARNDLLIGSDGPLPVRANEEL